MKAAIRFMRLLFVLLLVPAGFNSAQADVEDTVIEIIDNGDEQKVEIIGDWQQSTWTGGGDFWEDDYLHDINTDKGSKTIRFYPDISTGKYGVYIRYTSSSNRADNVPVDIDCAEGVLSQTINQKQNGGKWILLGAYEFSGDGDEFVEIGNENTNGYVIADAVAFVALADADPCLSDLVAYWNFDQTGEVIVDQAGENTGWIKGAVDTGGVTDNGLQFDGDDSALVSDSEDLRLTDAFTLCAWVMEDTPAQYAKIVSRRDGDYFYFLGVDNGRPYAGVGDGDSYTVSLKSKAMPTNEWHHLGAAYQADVDSLKLYYDGELIETVQVTEDLPYTEEVALSIGADKEGAAMYFKGAIDELAIFSEALTDNDLMELYMKGLAGNDYCADSLCGNGVIDPGEDCDGDADCPSNCRYGGCYATSVISYTPGTRKDGASILSERSNPENALGAPQGTDEINFVSLGFGGELILEFDSRIVNRGGTDLRITETSYGSPSCTSYPETARVYASMDGSTWEDLGTGCLDSEYDLGALDYATYIKIVDESDPSEFGDSDEGFDVDGVEALSCRDANSLPVANDDIVSTDEDVSVAIEVLLNDTDEDGDSLSIDSYTQPSNGTITDNGEGTLTYLPESDYSGTDSFTYIVSDGNGGTDSAVVTITINAVNDTPIANDDAATTNKDVAVSIDALSNDSDADGDSIAIASISQPANGTATNNGDGTISYVPVSGFSGDDTFSYTISDGNGGTATANIHVNVIDVVAPPVVSISPEWITIIQGESVTLTWTATSAEYAHIDNGIGSVSTSGSITIDPEYTTFYVLTVTGPGGSANVQAEVHVTGGPAEQTEATFGYQYNDLIPDDAGIDYYDEERFAIVTGLVYDIDETPIEGVKAMILDCPEYGTAETDADGRYAIPVEGGGYYTVAFQKAGMIPAHRKANVPWNDFAVTEPLVMIEEDTASTTITFDGSADTVITHQSTLISDEAGTRSATLVFSGDNVAYLADENGERIHELPTITVRATEYTTPDAMPAELPPTSAFTYCAELSVDGVDRVEFRNHVRMWVDNFIGFDVGDYVPLGYYDRDEGVWVPYWDGIVVQLLDTDGDGQVDAADEDGDGEPDDVDWDGDYDDEVDGLEDSSRYKHGESYWLVWIDHFTPLDHNWPYGPPVGAIDPNADGEPEIDAKCEGDCPTKTNSYVEARSRIYHEDIQIPGTDMMLHYASDRVSGYDTKITIPASGDEVPDSLEEIVIEVDIAGRTLEKTLDPLPNQTAVISWDGTDFSGELISCSVTATVKIGFTYKALYYESANVDWYQSFARIGQEGNDLQRGTNNTLTSWKQYDIKVDPPALSSEVRDVIADGWSFSNYHQLLKKGDIRLVKGDGSVLETIHEKYKYNYLDISGVITTVAGDNSESGNSGDGGYAIDAKMEDPKSVAVDKEGNLFILDQDERCIRKVDGDGIISTIAGTGSYGFGGDGGSAEQAVFSYLMDIAVDDNGNIFIADRDNHRIRKVDQEGIIETIAGIGEPISDSGDYCIEGGCVPGEDYDIGDNWYADEAYLFYPESVAVDNYGNVYISDTWHHCIRKVDPSGVISTVAGVVGVPGDGDDNLSAFETNLNHPTDLFVDDGGNIYVNDSYNDCIRKIDASGLVTKILEYGSNVSVYDFVVDEMGNIYIADGSDHIVYKTDDYGGAKIVVGTGGRGDQSAEDIGDGGFARNALLCYPSGLAFDPVGNLYIAQDRCVRKCSPPSPTVEHAEVDGTIYTESNSIGYVISDEGLHTATIDLHTGVVLESFEHGEDGRLDSITDQFGRQTKIFRNDGDIVDEIVSPDGLHTFLTVDMNDNQLENIILPDGSEYSFEYTLNGDLMTAEIEPAGNRFEHFFDEAGKITHITDDEGGDFQYNHSVSSGVVFSSIETAEGNITSYQDYNESSEGKTSIITDANGYETHYEYLYETNSGTKILPCGTELNFAYGFDTEYNNKFLKSSEEVLPSGLSKTIVYDKTYEDLNSDGAIDIFIDMITINDDKVLTVTQDIGAASSIVSSPENRTSTVIYDPYTLLTQSYSVPELFDINYAYDLEGRLVSVTTGTRSSSFTYDYNGFLDSVTDPEGHVKTYTNDDLGRVIGISRPDGGMIDFIYDENGNMTLLTNPNSVDHGFSYNGVNKPVGYETPLSGSYSYVYDRDRRLTQTNFPSGKQIVNVYTDDLLTQIQTPETDIDLTYSCSDKVASMSSNGETIEYGYDGKLLTDVSLGGTLNKSLSYTYNNDFNITELNYAGETESFSYDLDGLLTESSGFSVTRNEENGLPELVSGGSVTLTREFNGYGEVESSTLDISGTDMVVWSLERDDNGRITGKTETAGGIAANYEYTYDSVGRLLTVTKAGTLVEEYEYDANGVRVSETNTLRDVSGRTSTYSDEDHLLTAGSVLYQHDLDGFLSEKTDGAETTFYDYSSRGELLNVTLPDGRVIEYVHDPLGRRIAKTVDGTITEKYLWSGLTTLLAVYDGSDNLIQRFEYADGRMPIAMIQEGVTYYLGYDQVGSLRVVSDSVGNVIKRVEYDTFGNVIADTNEAFKVPFGFAGGLQDPDTGLVRFGYRDYDPDTGRWTAKDPIFFAGGDTDLYGYVQNDPVNFSDPLGLARYFVSYTIKSYSAVIAPVGMTKITGLVVSTQRNRDGTYNAKSFEGKLYGATLGPLPWATTINNEEYFEDIDPCEKANVNNIEGMSWYLSGSTALGPAGFSGGAYKFGNLIGTKETPSGAEGLDLGVDFMMGRTWTTGPMQKATSDIFPENR